MFTKLCESLFIILAFVAPCMAADMLQTPPPQTTPKTYEEIMAERPHSNTKCATAAFANALAQTANTVSESDSEEKIQEWIKKTFSDKSVLNTVLACPEVSSVADDETIKFEPIKYTFAGGREIVINYETQPKIFKQRLQLANKRSLPSSEISPRVGPDGDGSVWTNTDPSWYGIMIVEHGALNDFIGSDRNNTISLKYIADNIDKLYPNASDNGGQCTSRSALAYDHLTINKATAKTVSINDDSNDYYIAGDINLQWISYAEIALDVVLTVATMGGFAAISGVTKSVRASKALKGLGSTVKTLSKSDDVVKWVKTTSKIDKITDEIKALDKVTDAAKIADKTRELDQLKDTAKTLEQTADVEKYRDATKTYSELNKMRHTLQDGRSALRQRGNVFARTAKLFKGFRASISNNKLINHAAKLARSSSKSGRIRDWLFHSSLKNAGSIAKAGAAGGVLYGGLKFIGGMYDWTETSTGDFTSGVDFSPLLLLSADDIEGQENVINHGMWLLWMGDTTVIEDDDAAYLQAMDFAAKLYQDLMEEQGNSNTPCNVDIFVVHPIMRNPGTDNTELYYLIMNDEPWTTAK